MLPRTGWAWRAGGGGRGCRRTGEASTPQPNAPGPWLSWEGQLRTPRAGFRSCIGGEGPNLRGRWVHLCGTAGKRGVDLSRLI